MSRIPHAQLGEWVVTPMAASAQDDGVPPASLTSASSVQAGRSRPYCGVICSLFRERQIMACARFEPKSGKPVIAGAV